MVQAAPALVDTDFEGDVTGKVQIHAMGVG